MVKILAGFIFLIIFTTLAFQIFDRYFFNYRIVKDSIQFVLFGKIPMIHIQLADIAEMRKVSFMEATFQKGIEGLFVLRCGNRLWGQIVLIRRKKGIFKRVLITPDNADEFISKIRERIERTSVSGP